MSNLLTNIQDKMEFVGIIVACGSAVTFVSMIAVGTLGFIL